jgi:hypothetical protein
VSKDLLVQFVGFDVKPLAREYIFTVRESSTERREFTFAISNEDFNGHRVRYQDAPAVCSAKLHRELATYANHPPGTYYQVSEADLEDYRSTHSPQSSKSRFKRKTEEDL